MTRFGGVKEQGQTRDWGYNPSWPPACFFLLETRIKINLRSSTPQNEPIINTRDTYHHTVAHSSASHLSLTIPLATSRITKPTSSRTLTVRIKTHHHKNALLLCKLLCKSALFWDPGYKNTDCELAGRRQLYQQGTALWREV